MDGRIISETLIDERVTPSPRCTSASDNGYARARRPDDDLNCRLACSALLRYRAPCVSSPSFIDVSFYLSHCRLYR
ncbi:hypothetical protein OUZ56_002934 [Daphnia magna]|uniref:Uncharacterized protein n=1 Tax=Daphnia magna TaxID=35525 RepID=A0ABR0A797_9CRUS|nr:hypothetical protein OUZ56_002934 [Daphnia magna]